jgi:hypothetical protein
MKSSVRFSLHCLNFIIWKSSVLVEKSRQLRNMIQNKVSSIKDNLQIRPLIEVEIRGQSASKFF